MPSNESQAVAGEALKALGPQLRRAFLAIVAERAARCFWPVPACLMLGLSVWLWGALAPIPREGIAALFVAFAFLLIWLAYRGIRRFEWPDADAAADRLDREMADRPVAALRDGLALGRGEETAEAFWRAHVAAMADRARAARAREPDLRLARQDPWAVRLVALFAFLSAVLFANPENPLAPRADALASAVPAGPVFEGWAEPPRYTGRPTVYLDGRNGQSELSLAEGTLITIRVYGESGDVAVAETVTTSGQDRRRDAGDGPKEIRLTVGKSGSLSLSVAGEAVWDLSVQMIPDQPPTVEMAAVPGANVNGGLELPFRASDDYGVVAGYARISLDLAEVERAHGLAADPEPRDPVMFELPLPYHGTTREFEESLSEDVAGHPFAGLPVRITLGVEDAGGNTGASEPVSTLLPARRFYDAVAAAVVEQRRDILWTRDNAARVARVLKAITYLPAGEFEDAGTYLATRSAIKRLDIHRKRAEGLGGSTRDEVAAMLWRVALQIEEGDLANARERLRRAQERLSAALERGASDEEVAALMDELRTALDDFLREMAEDAARNPDRQLAEVPDSNEFAPEQLNDMIDRLRELMEQGRTAEAQQLLRQLQGLLENLQAAREGVARPGSGGDRTIDGLRDTLRRQQGLADETFRQMQENRGAEGVAPEGLRPRTDGQPGEGGTEGRLGEQGSDPDASGAGSGGDLAARQEALRRLLEQQRRTMPPSPGQAGGDSLEDAETAMGEAAENLERGDNNRALDDQARAMEALRQGMREIEEARRSQAFGTNTGESGPGRANRDITPMDPLGRPSGPEGSAVARGRPLPEGEFYDRSREILDEIRRRSGERERPESELDYLKRLLDRF